MRALAGAIMLPVLLAACETEPQVASPQYLNAAMPSEQRVPFDALKVVEPRSIGARHHAVDIVPPAPLPQSFKVDCDIDRKTGVVSRCRVGADGVGMSDPEVAARRRVLGIRFDVSAFDPSDQRPLRTDIPVTLSLDDKVQLPAPPATLLKPSDVNWLREPDSDQAAMIRNGIGPVGEPTEITIACQVQSDHSLACLDRRAEPDNPRIRNGAGYYIASYYKAAATLPSGEPSAGAWVEFRYSLVPMIVIAPPSNN